MRSAVVAIVLSMAVHLGTAQPEMQRPIVMQGPPPQNNQLPSDNARAQQAMADSMAKTLKITFGNKSAEWTPLTLAALPHKSLTVNNEHSKANETYAGVPVIDLLTRLGVPEKPRGKDFKLYLVAVGSDGYEVVYSLGEITPDVHDATVMVADSEDGKPITADGPMKMVSTGEKRPARWVRNLVAIRVMAAQ